MVRVAWIVAVMLVSAAPAWAGFHLEALTEHVWEVVLLVFAALIPVLLWMVRRERRDARRLAEVLVERDDALKVVRERESLFRHLFEEANVGLFRSTLDGSRFLVANAALARMYGFSSVERFLAEVRPVDIYDSPKQREDVVGALQAGGACGDFELSYTRADGTRGVVMVRMHLDTDNGWIEGSALDITSLRQAHGELARQHRFLQTLLNAIPNPVFYKDASGRYRLLNDAFLRMMGKEEDELLGRNVYDISPPELARTYEEMDNALLLAQGQSTQRYEYKVQAEAGVRSVLFFKESVLDDDGAVQGLVGTISDVTALREKERALEVATARYRDILDNSVEGIAEFSPDGSFVAVNPALARMLGFETPAELLAAEREGSWQFLVDPARREAMVQLVRRHGQVKRFEVLTRRWDGGAAWLSLSVSGVLAADGTLEGMHGLALDVTAQKAEYEELTRMASTDDLTGLANRASMLLHLDRMLAQARAQGAVVGVLFMDLDGFKEINDRFGHQAGDQVLVQVAERVRQRLRRSDVLARMGGDEFAMVLWDLGAEENLHAVVKGVLRDMQAPFECLGIRCVLGASLGASLFPEHGGTSSELLALADQAMYEVKRKGKNGLCIHGRSPVFFGLSVTESGGGDGLYGQ